MNPEQDKHRIRTISMNRIVIDIKHERNERKVRINRNSILNELGNENDNNFFMDLAYFNIL